MTVTRADWRQRYAEKLTTAEEAVTVVRPGDRVVIGMMYLTPLSLCRALAARHSELSDVEIENSISTFIRWWPDSDSPFRVQTFFLQATDRPAMRDGLLDYVVAPPSREDESYWLRKRVDVFLTQVSPPDEDGWCSFGMCLWGALEVAQAATHVIGEVNERFIRTGGANRVHISRFEKLVPAASDWRLLKRPERSEEEHAVTEVICALVAHEIIRDGDTVQMGTGTVSSALAPYLSHRHDLGIHTELIFGGVPQLVEQGVVNGRRKTLHPGKTVGTSFGPLTEEELRLVDGSPHYELYPMGHTNDVRVIMQHDNMVAVNNALLVDVTGQISGESLGTTVYSGHGGGIAFPVGALHARNGRAVTVLPSTSVVEGRRVSRILPVLPEGTVVTLPRGYADIVVTEYGIARLKGKSLRERTEELIAVAHPDFRAELRAATRRLHRDWAR